MPSLSKLTEQLDFLRDDTVNLFGAYESDEDVEALRERAISIRDRAENIQASLGTISTGLAEL